MTSNNPTWDLKMDCKDLLATGALSDLTISCQGKEFNVHKVVLYLQSPYFRKLFGGRFKEATENLSRLELDDSPEALGTLVYYLYHFVYDEASRGGISVMPFAVKVYAVADKYQVNKLKVMAASRLKRVCDPVGNLDEFIATVHLIDECTSPDDRTLWDIVMPAMKDNIRYLLGNDKFQALIFDMKELNLNLLALLDESTSDIVISPASPPAGETDTRLALQDAEDRNNGVMPGHGAQYFGAGHRLG